MCDDNEFNDMDLNQLKEKLNQLGKYQTLSFKDDQVRWMICLHSISRKEYLKIVVDERSQRKFFVNFDC